VWATAAVLLGYFLWASISLVEHWVGRVSLLLVAALALAWLLRWAYRRATRGYSMQGMHPIILLVKNVGKDKKL
jgi:membrane protein DedA with SNARE-associated domain